VKHFANEFSHIIHIGLKHRQKKEPLPKEWFLGPIRELAAKNHCPYS
jgi:hypothetical protein